MSITLRRMILIVKVVAILGVVTGSLIITSPSQVAQAGEKMCKASARAYWLNNRDSSIAGEHQWALRIDLPGKYYPLVLRGKVYFLGNWEPYGVDLRQRLSSDTNDYIDVWIHSRTWAWRYAVQYSVLTDPRNWAVWYPCASSR